MKEIVKDYYNENEVEKRNCPLCGNSDYMAIYKERGSVGIVRCGACGVIYTNPIVKAGDKKYWGNEERYYEETRLILEGSAPHYRDTNYLEDLRRIENIKPRGRFLDIGTNMGFFLRHARGKGWDVFGVEPSPSLSEMARKYFGLNVKTAYLENAGFEEDFFDIVTMADVFEHIRHPKKMLVDVKKVLKKDGILFIKIPNGNYNLLKLRLAKMTRRTRRHDLFDSYEHLTHFSHKALKRFLEGCGFKIIKTFISSPIQLPAWHKRGGQYYQHPSPWTMDAKNYIARLLFYWISKIEFLLRFRNIGYFASNITIIAQKR